MGWCGCGEVCTVGEKLCKGLWLGIDRGYAAAGGWCATGGGTAWDFTGVLLPLLKLLRLRLRLLLNVDKGCGWLCDGGRE